MQRTKSREWGRGPLPTEKTKMEQMSVCHPEPGRINVGHTHLLIFFNRIIKLAKCREDGRC